ncbi:hybrid sensor histidine kinase/response regulator [Anaeromyxobacter oryzae]|uniref:histidine kinase n=1 Tax=Anaeromyxobacter oryzae TaxID=2918170 RepID=A0ABM7WXP6_9BACT|nr:ATP-binding protein [Anaeromyxobacter oryzae]BDG04169.1 hypothetical protein AMOR_31650 [Anaeromyxobacter oryzae]
MVAAGEVDEKIHRVIHDGPSMEGQQAEPGLQLHEELPAAQVEAGLRRCTELFDFAPIGYLAIDAGGAIRDANLAAARLLGTERAGLPGQRFAAFLSAPDAAAFDRFLEDVLGPAGTEPGCACTLELVRESRDAAHVRLTATPLGGTSPLALVAAEDVTAQKRAEDALHEETRRKDEFLGALSHELRNPLAPIRNGLTLLARAPAGGEQARKALAIIDRQVEHLARIVDGLMDVTRIARGKVSLNRERVELGDLVRRTLEDHRATFEASGIALESRLPRDRCWVDVDATRVAQALGNLLGNAAKFSVHGGRVDVVVQRDGQAAAVSVRDTGVGVAHELRERLFEPFSQGPQPLDRTRGGLGLGLATAKGLVELHGGTVSMHSEGPGHGAEFTIRLPTVDPPTGSLGEHVPGPPHRRRVLVIDDNEDGASTLKEVLELSGHEVRVAVDGPSGIALAHAFDPDVVLCDIGLPGMDGYDVARALRADDTTRRAYLIALSGYALPDDLRRARDAGFDRHQAKPPTIESLDRLLEESPFPHG